MAPWIKCATCSPEPLRTAKGATGGSPISWFSSMNTSSAVQPQQQSHGAERCWYLTPTTLPSSMLRVVVLGSENEHRLRSSRDRISWRAGRGTRAARDG